LPKSAIEALVSGFNENGCPDAVKTQILSDPREALKRMADGRRAVNVETSRLNPRQKSARPTDIHESVKETKAQIAILYGLIYFESPYGVTKHARELKELREDLELLLKKVNELVSPGKSEAGQIVG